MSRNHKYVEVILAYNPPKGGVSSILLGGPAPRSNLLPIFDKKGNPSYVPSIDKWQPFFRPSLDLYIPLTTVNALSFKNDQKCLFRQTGFFGGGGGGGGGRCKKDIQIAFIKTKNIGENRKNRKSKAPRSELMDELN